jgi:hypothetical protein
VTSITVQTDVIRVATRQIWRGVENHKGTIGASRTIAGDGFFSSQARGSKEDARSSAPAEKDLTFYVKRFL